MNDTNSVSTYTAVETKQISCAKKLELTVKDVENCDFIKIETEIGQICWVSTKGNCVQKTKINIKKDLIPLMHSNDRVRQQETSRKVLKVATR